VLNLNSMQDIATTTCVYWAGGTDYVASAGATSMVCVTEQATSTIGIYNGANFQEWLFVAGVIIFLLSFMVWGRIFMPIKTLYGE
jgi:hypothetical protein